MENLKSVIEGFRFSYTQMTAVFFVLLITYLINKYLVNKSLQFIDQQTLWIRYLRYWFPLFRIILWGFSIYICFSILSPPREILFATATSAGVAIGLAAQELIKNLFGSVII